MKIIIEMEVATLKGLLHVAPKADIRPYLNSINIAGNDKRTYAVATDGHMMLAAVRNTVYADGSIESASPFEFIIPRDMVDGIKVDKHCTLCMISFDRETTEVSIVARGQTISGKAVEGKFPDWQRVIPNGSLREYVRKAADKGDGDGQYTAQFNPLLLAQLNKGIDTILGRKTAIAGSAGGAAPTMRITHNGPNNAALVTSGHSDAIIGVVMPMRNMEGPTKADAHWYVNVAQQIGHSELSEEVKA